MNDSIIAQSEITCNDIPENNLSAYGVVRKKVLKSCWPPDLNGHEVAEFWGRCFDVTEMKRRPRKRISETGKRSKKGKKTPPGSSPDLSHGYSNTVRAISQVSTNVELPSSCYIPVLNPKALDQSEFRVPETGTVEELLKFYEGGELKKGVQLYFSDLSDFETFNDANFGKCPEFVNELGPLRHFRRPEILNNPIGPFLGFDWAQCRYFGEWDRDLWGAYMPLFGAAYLKHKEIKEPIIFQYKPDSEKWSFRCAGQKERFSLHYPTVEELPYIYVLERGGVKVYIIPPELHKDPKLAPVLLVIGSLEFRDLVPATVVEREVLSFLAQFGFKENKELRKLSRIDIQVTSDKCSVSDIRNFDSDDKVVCRANGRADFRNVGRSPSGDPCHGTYYFGDRSNGTVCFRCYDKRNELEDTEYKDNGRKFYYFYSCLGDLQLRENTSHWDQLTRFEFELKAKFFKQFDVKTFEDFERKMPSIVEYLTNNWFRIIEVEKGYNHSSRIKTAKIWEDISASFMCFAEYFATKSGGSVSVTRRTKEERVYANPDWPKTVRTAEEFLSRAAGELALVCGIDDGSEIGKNFIDLVLLPVLYRRCDKIRDYVIRRGAGYIKTRSFLIYDSRQYYDRRKAVPGSTD